MGTVRALIVGASLVLMSAATAGAIEQDIEPVRPGGPTPAAPTAAPEAGAPAEAAAFDVALGIAGTSDYVSRGITNSGNHPAIQGYIEPSYGMFYVNLWASNVDFGEDFEGVEIDAALGVRPEFGPLSLDLGYVHYFYAPADVSPDYGELFAKADYNIHDRVTLGARVFFAPDFNQSGETATFVAAGARVSLPKDFSVYAGVGYQFFEDPDAFEQWAWTAGVSYNWKAVTFDLRYWDTNLGDNECLARSGFADGCDARIVGTVSVNTSWSALRGMDF